MVEEEKSSQKPKDVLLMLLEVLKHIGYWDVLANVIGMSGATLEPLIVVFLTKIACLAFEKLVKDIACIQ